MMNLMLKKKKQIIEKCSKTVTSFLVMNAKSYFKVGQKIYGYDFKPGFSLTLKKKKSNVTVACDSEMKNPNLTSTINVLPGIFFKIDSKKESPCSIDWEPEIFEYFWAYIPRNSHSSGIIAKLSSDHVNNSVTFLVKYKKILQSIKIEPSCGLWIHPDVFPENVGEMNVNEIGRLLSRLFIYDLQLTYKRLRLSALFDTQKNYHSAGAFLKLTKNLRSGFLFNYNFDGIKSLNLFGKVSENGSKLALIGTVLNDKPSIEAKTKIKLEKSLRFGFSAKYDGDFGGDVGLIIKSRQVKTQVIYSLLPATFNHTFNVNAQFKAGKSSLIKFGVKTGTEIQKPQIYANLEIE